MFSANIQQVRREEVLPSSGQVLWHTQIRCWTGTWGSCGRIHLELKTITIITIQKSPLKYANLNKNGFVVRPLWFSFWFLVVETCTRSLVFSIRKSWHQWNSLTSVDFLPNYTVCVTEHSAHSTSQLKSRTLTCTVVLLCLVNWVSQYPTVLGTKSAVNTQDFFLSGIQRVPSWNLFCPAPK